MSNTWTPQERGRALAHAEANGVDILVIGGGITGAGVLRDAASRGLRTLLVERSDFAAGTSSRSSKLVHGGLRYLQEGQFRLTREAVQERDLLLRLNPHLVQPLQFLTPLYREGKLRPWQLRAAMWIYAGLANFRKSASFEMAGRERVGEFCSGLRQDGLLGGALYWDAQVDDARLVLETLRSARQLGAEAANYAEVLELLHADGGKLVGARVRDHLSGRTHTLRAHVVLNAAGPGIERLRRLDHFIHHPQVRPAKGVHIVIPRERVPAQGAVTFQSRDGRHLVMIPWDSVTIIGTTDTFTDEIDEPTVNIEEVHYLLAAANDAFPHAALTTNDIRSVYAGVRPLVAPPNADVPPSSVSREHQIYEDPSGLISAAGGKLTTYRSMGASLVKRALRRLPAARRAAAGPSRTALLPLRQDAFEPKELEAELNRHYQLGDLRAQHLVRSYGADAEVLLRESPTDLHGAIGSSHFSWAEIPWSFRTECPANLCDLLERRLRLAIFAVGQGLPELDRIARLAGEAAGWDAERTHEEARAYAETVRRRYQIVAPNHGTARSAA